MSHTRRPRTTLTRAAAVLGALALTAGGAVTAAAPVTAAPTAANTVAVHADQPFRPVTHVGTGSLYGLANSTSPSDAYVDAIKPNTFVQMPEGGHQQRYGQILQVAAKAKRAGAKVVDRLADYYSGFPYHFSWDTWFESVDAQVRQVNASGITNLTSYALWNEPDGTWNTANGTFEDFWTKTYREVRRIDPTTPIQGPSFSDNITDMQNFLENAVATDTVPDILAWHELETSSKIAGDIASVEAMEDDLGISRRPIAIEEYAAPPEVGIPGDLVGYIAKFERLGVHDAELAFWNQPGTLGDLLTGMGGQPNGAYWLYRWYAQMSGSMVTTTPPGNTDFDAAASVTDDKKELDVITGGTTGTADVDIDGLDRLALGDNVNVKVEFTPSYGRTTAVPAPTTISNTTYQVGSDGSITVPIVMNAAYGYHVVVTPATTPTSLAGTYTITNLNSGLALDTAGSGTTAGTAVEQATPSSGSATQTWLLVAAGSGLYKIVNKASGLVLGIKDASTSNGAPALVWTDSGSDDHLWQVVPDGNGHYRFADYGTGLVLGVAAMSTAPGAQVLQWTDGSVTSNCTPDGPRVAGELGTALSLCNTASYVRLPDGVVSGLTGDYTVSAWVNPAANNTWSRVFDIGNGTSASMFLTVSDGSTLRYAITTGGSGAEQHIDGTGLLPLNKWSLVTVTVAGTTGTLYVDGTAVGTNTAMTDHPAAFGDSTANYLGKSQYADPPLDGAIDDVNIYDRALGASEVRALADGQVGDGDVVHYTFDEAGGTTVPDSSGHGSDATIVVANGATSTSATDAATADHFWTLTPVTPVSTTITGSSPAVNGWYDSAVLVSLGGAPGGEAIRYRLDGAPWKTYTRALKIGADGAHQLDTEFVDAAGSVVDGSTGSTPIKIDKTAPVAAANAYPGKTGSPRNPVAVTFAAGDVTSGVRSVEYQTGSGAWTEIAPGGAVTLSDVGVHLVHFRATDNAGNTSAARSITVRINADPKTRITARPRTLPAGGTGTYSLAGFTNGATITLTLGSTSLGTVIADLHGAITVSRVVPASVAPGSYQLTATDGTLTATTTQKVTG